MLRQPITQQFLLIWAILAALIVVVVLLHAAPLIAVSIGLVGGLSLSGSI